MFSLQAIAWVNIDPDLPLCPYNTTEPQWSNAIKMIFVVALWTQYNIIFHLVYIGWYQPASFDLTAHLLNEAK